MGPLIRTKTDSVEPNDLPSTTMARIFRKRFPHGTKVSLVRNEIKLQTLAAKLGLAPRILKTDNATYIDMQHLGDMSVSDMYGDEIEGIPPRVLAGMWSCIYMLFYQCDISYRDVWPRNFMEQNGRVWIIDFGHAQVINWKKENKIDKYVLNVIEEGYIDHWNPEFT